MKKNKLISACLAFTIFASSLVVSAEAPAEDASSDVAVTEEAVEETGPDIVPVEYRGDKVELASSGGTTLYLDAGTGNIILEDDRTGESFQTKQIEIEGSNEAQKSDFSITYYKGDSLSRYSSTSSMNTYEWSVNLDTFSYYEVENGVGIKYEIGDTAPTVADFPRRISEERMQTLVLDHLTSAEIRMIEDEFRLLSEGVYASTRGADVAMSPLLSTALYDLFYVKGQYTAEELAFDMEENGLEAPTGKVAITLYVEYSLQGGDLVVTIPTQDIETLEEYPIKSIDFLPYFMTGNTDEEGYLFIPDESGALMYLDNDKLNETQYTNAFYNGDLLATELDYAVETPTLNLPVYGIKKDNLALLAIIEEGSEIATLKANNAGSYLGETFSKINSSFEITARQNVQASNLVDYPITLAQERPYSEEIVVRYSLLTGSDANYVGMAKDYQEYLVDHNLLKETEAQETASLYLELLGSVTTTKYFAGIPYEGTNPLTTFDQAEEMLSYFAENGIDNMKVEYKGIANGGLSFDKLTKVSIEGNLGGANGLKDLVAAAESYNAEIFPSFEFQTVDSDKGVATDEHAYFISGLEAQAFDYEPVLFEEDDMALREVYYLRGTYLPEYVTEFSKSYNNLGIGNVSATDLMSNYIGNYKKDDHILVNEVVDDYASTAAFMDEQYNLMLSNPMAAGYAYADYLTDIPIDDSDYRVLDTYVPFMQMVLQGYIDYSSPVLNVNNLDISDSIMGAMESGSALKFRLTYEDATQLFNTDYDNVFVTEYDLWKEEIVARYAEYNEFYEAVKGSSIINHEISHFDDGVRFVEYDNGVKVYFNYEDTQKRIDGVNIEANSYKVVF